LLAGVVSSVWGLSACGGEVMVGTVAEGLGGSGGYAPKPCDCLSGTSELELGVEWYSGGSITTRDVLEDPSEFAHRISTEHYAGNGFVSVTRDYDVLWDVLDGARDASEQIVRLRTSADSEELSTWDSTLRSLGGGTDESPVSPATFYTIMLGFKAVASSKAEPNNGILELDPAAGETLKVEWERPASDDWLAGEVEMRN
jgi:hypothetical protein